MRGDAARRQRARLRRQEADRERLLEARQRELVGHGLAERLPERHLDEVDADRVADEVGHLAARDPRRHLDHRDAAVGDGDQLRERDAVAQPERVHRLHRDLLGERELVAVDRRGVDVDPADAEADARAAAAGRRA